MVKVQPKQLEIKIEWRWHDSHNRRIWRNDWVGDQFEIINEDEFAVILKFCKQFSIPVTEVDD